MSQEQSTPWTVPWPDSARAPDSPRIARVLIVDDHDVSRRICAGICDLFHCAWECASSGAEALAALGRGSFDVVLMDIQMPGMNGLETTRAIRAMPGRAGQVPIVAVTNDAGPEQTQSYLAAGMADVVPKPVPPARLFKAIIDAVGRGRYEQRSWAAA
jgi:CheY-like chemotaxis protein